MKNLFKYIGLFSIILFGFYYTEKMNNIVLNNNKLMIEINNNIDDYNKQAKNAFIEGKYIIPGLNGYAVNVLKSYNKMKYLDTFNSYYLEYDIVKPSISIDNNKDKIIKYGNSDKNSVSIIIKDNHNILDYLENKKIKVTRLINKDTFISNANYEQINNDINNYERVEKLLNRYKLNKNICYIKNNQDNCKNKYLFEESINLNNYNLGTIKDNIKSGYIIFINDNVSLSDFKILVRQIYYQDLNIKYLSELIKE